MPRRTLPNLGVLESRSSSRGSHASLGALQACNAISRRIFYFLVTANSTAASYSQRTVVPLRSKEKHLMFKSLSISLRIESLRNDLMHIVNGSTGKVATVNDDSNTLGARFVT